MTNAKKQPTKQPTKRDDDDQVDDGREQKPDAKRRVGDGSCMIDHDADRDEA